MGTLGGAKINGPLIRTSSFHNNNNNNNNWIATAFGICFFLLLLEHCVVENIIFGDFCRPS